MADLEAVQHVRGVLDDPRNDGVLGPDLHAPSVLESPLHDADLALDALDGPLNDAVAGV